MTLEQILIAIVGFLITALIGSNAYWVKRRFTTTDARIDARRLEHDALAKDVRECIDAATKDFNGRIDKEMKETRDRLDRLTENIINILRNGRARG